MQKLKTVILIVGDIAALYITLLLSLALRYGSEFYEEFLTRHLSPFSIIFILWLAVFYVAGLYDLRHLRNNVDFFKIILSAIFVSTILSIVAFYSVPIFGITPKTNLLLFAGVFSIVEVLWRRGFNTRTADEEAPNRVLLIVPTSTNLVNELLRDSTWLRQIGYDISAKISEEDIAHSPEKLGHIAFERKINFIAVPRRLRNNNKLAKYLYALLGKGIEIRDLSTFYESVMRKVPLEEVEESWFLENLANLQTFYDPLKRAAEFIAASILAILLLPLGILITILVKLSSPGPAIYKQARVGQGGKEFVLYKFRTMKLHNNHAWPGENDERITKIGGFLRKIHFDEWPQLWNIIKGDISVVGPRPDFVDFYKNLEREIPYYSIRTIIKPGLTGWAQIHKPVTASLEDTRERLGYDLYYIKNRSLILDIAIVLKTLKVLVTAAGK